MGAIGGAVLGFGWGCEQIIEAEYLRKSDQEDAKREAMESRGTGISPGTRLDTGGLMCPAQVGHTVTSY